MKSKHNEIYEIDLENHAERNVFKCVFNLIGILKNIDPERIFILPIVVKKPYLYVTDGRVLIKVKTNFEFEGNFGISKVSQHKYILIKNEFKAPDYEKVLNNKKEEKEISDIYFSIKAYRNSNIVKIIKACPLDVKYIKLVLDLDVGFKFYASPQKAIFRNDEYDITIVVMAIDMERRIQ
jgi:hypothetical protein